MHVRVSTSLISVKVKRNDKQIDKTQTCFKFDDRQTEQLNDIDSQNKKKKICKQTKVAERRLIKKLFNPHHSLQLSPWYLSSSRHCIIPPWCVEQSAVTELYLCRVPLCSRGSLSTPRYSTMSSWKRSHRGGGMTGWMTQ